MRHIIYLFDGTWQWAGRASELEGPNNIYKINCLIEAVGIRNQPQIVFYTRGSGAVEGVRRYSEGAFGTNIYEDISDAYINICSNWDVRDTKRGNLYTKIYMLGFSRGAITARALSGFISVCGILRPEYVIYFHTIWDVYVKSYDESIKKSNVFDPRCFSQTVIDNIQKKLESIYLSVDACFVRPVKIEFLGVFDTVLGVEDTSSEFNPLFGMPNKIVDASVLNAVQVLSIDEHRNQFRPVMWSGKSKSTSYFEQVWLPGFHSDIGGGAAKEGFLQDISLITMVDRMLARTSIKFDVAAIKALKKSIAARLSDIMVGPENKKILEMKNSISTAWKLASGSVQRNVDHTQPQTLHPIAFDLMKSNVKFRGDHENGYSLRLEFKKLRLSKWYISRQLK